MELTKLSTKGQIIIPKPIRLHQNWDIGQELVVLETDEGVLLKSKPQFQRSDLKKIAGCLKFEGKSKTLKEMDDAIKKGIVTKR